MRKWRLPLTYQPKIEPVRKGECRQTIRVRNVNKKTGKMAPAKQVGDLIMFFAWDDRPYWSKQIPLTEYEPLREVLDITILPCGILSECKELDCYSAWFWDELDWLSRLDFISPPTGEELRDVLVGKNGKIPDQGVEAQILRW
jgi:hypothetical protein